MKKALTVFLIVLAIAASAVVHYLIFIALFGEKEPEPEPVPYIASKPQETVPSSAGSGNASGAGTGTAAEPVPAEPAVGAGEDGNQTLTGLTMTVQQSTGEMVIERPALRVSAPMGDAGTWTIFVYLCGSDLESDQDYGGTASDDVEEMCRATASSAVRFVVQTGGAWQWYNDQVNPTRNQRFVVENGELIHVKDSPWTGMGRSATLADFLTWGVQNYGADHMGVILWNHGGGSISGVCFDERDDYDSLTLRELDAALLSAFGSMTDRFEFFGFDACLMATVETANILASYANYMIASEETEPGTGWDYETIGSYLADHPGADGAELGRVVCDSFYTSCRRALCAQTATLSVVDLRKLDTLLQRFNSFSESMYNAGGDTAVLSNMVRGIMEADNFGGNNKVDGYTNMVDLGGVVSACAEWTEGADAVLEALSDAVVYQVTGSDHRNASGLAVYYPLSVQGSQELSVFGSICVSPYYLSFVDRQSQGSLDTLFADSYESDTWFEDDTWNWLGSYAMDDDTGYFDYSGEDDDYWAYLDDYETDGESTLITFDVEPQLDEDGVYHFVLSDEGWEYAAEVYAVVYQMSADEEDYIELGETWDITADWDTGYFADCFDGYWLSLPNGQDLATYIVDVTDQYVVYSSPIYLNGERTNLRMRQSWDGTVIVEGAWAGIDENGSSSREIIRLQDGDEIVPFYYSYTTDDGEEGSYSGVTFIVDGELEIGYDILGESDYYYAFCIIDVYGNSYTTDFTTFYVDEDGEIYFYED